MKIEQIYTGCLAEAAYYIESKGEAIIIDPLRDTNPYIQRADKDGATIKYIFETHFHADFVSGHVDLAKKTGASIVYGPTATASFDFIEAVDGQEFKIGDVTLRVLHTPGHTMESSTYLLIDENGKEHAIFTGDTLFLGDVGRPDLAIKSELTQEDLASMLFDSLRTKLMTLPDETIVYPGHGAGSSCGKNMSSETVGSLGDQKVNNYALRADMTKEEFIEELLDGILPPPQYFPKNAMLNKSELGGVEGVMEKANKAFSAEAFEVIANEKEALVIDTRNAHDFCSGHIPNSIFIGIDGSFATWVGTLIIDLQQPILLISDAGREEEIITRLARVGYDKVLGFLDGGFTSWADAGKEIATIQTIPSSEFEERMVDDAAGVNVMDVRKIGEFEAEHVDGAKHVSLNYINDNMASVDPKTTYHVHCAGGYRSVIFISILKGRGYENLINVEGGFSEIKETAVKTTDFVCSSEK